MSDKSALENLVDAAGAKLNEAADRARAQSGWILQGALDRVRDQATWV